MDIILYESYSIADTEVYNFHCSSSLYYLYLFFSANQISEHFLASFTFLLVIFIVFPLNCSTELERIVFAFFFLFTIVSLSVLTSNSCPLMGCV